MVQARLCWYKLKPLDSCSLGVCENIWEIPFCLAPGLFYFSLACQSKSSFCPNHPENISNSGLCFCHTLRETSHGALPIHVHVLMLSERFSCLQSALINVGHHEKGFCVCWVSFIMSRISAKDFFIIQQWRTCYYFISTPDKSFDKYFRINHLTNISQPFTIILISYDFNCLCIFPCKQLKSKHIFKELQGG